MTLHLHLWPSEGGLCLGGVPNDQAVFDAALARGVYTLPGGGDIRFNHLAVLKVQPLAELTAAFAAANLRLEPAQAAVAGQWISVCRHNPQRFWTRYDAEILIDVDGLAWPRLAFLSLPRPEAWLARGNSNAWNPGAWGFNVPTVEGQVTLGFELETQRTLDLRRVDPPIHDPDAPARWERRQIRNPDPGLVYDWTQRHNADDVNESMPLLRNLLAGRADMAAVQASFQSFVRDRAEDRNSDLRPLDQVRDSVAELADHPLEVVEDSSVEGFEIRTVGGLAMPAVCAAADAVYTLPHTIDHRCSFHIHTKLEGVRFGHSVRMAWHLIEYLLWHLDEVPASVLTRWQDAPQRDRYFRMDFSHDKYRWVHAHSLGTWEFRCFGGVANAAHAKVCLSLAERATKYAVAVARGVQTPLSGGLSMTPDAVRAAALTAVNAGVPLRIPHPTTVTAPGVFPNSISTSVREVS